MIQVPDIFKPEINIIYPPNNYIDFERWFDMAYEGDKGEREYLPIYFCAYQVNNNYGKDEGAMQKLQDFINELPKDKKYFTISQYDDGVGIDWGDRDVLEFNMSQKGENKYPIPLAGQNHPYKFNERRKYIANFIGTLTHPIREHAKKLLGNKYFYISFDHHDSEAYCKIMSQSVYTLCYRGYGLNSFRIKEALQYGSIPIYISDEFIEPYNMPFENFGIKLLPSELGYIKDIGDIFSADKTFDAKEIFDNYFTYSAIRRKILEVVGGGNCH